MTVAVHQVVSVLEDADAIGDEVRTLRRGLRRRGYASEIFVALRRPGQDEVRPLEELLEGPRPAAVLYHFATASVATTALAASGLPVVLVYHDVTPAEWFWGIDLAHYRGCALARDDVEALRGRTRLAIADSEFSRLALENLGFSPTLSVPLALRPLPPLSPSPPAPGETDRGHSLLAEARAAPTLLTVGRVAPNKCLEDCIRLVHAYRRAVDPRARLWLVGDDRRLPRYRDALQALVADLGETLAVRWLGRISEAELAACYAGCSLYVSMSEHEGFGGPLVEAMRAGLPVLAYDGGAVAETLGGAGIVVGTKDPLTLAEIAARLVRDTPLRRRCIAAGLRRAADLDCDLAIDRLCSALVGIGVPQPCPR